MPYTDIPYSVDDFVATITLNRPNKLNAWTSEMDADVNHAVERAATDDAAGTSCANSYPRLLLMGFLFRPVNHRFLLIHSTPHGRLMLTVLGGLAEFERHLILSRTNEGRVRAKARGVRFGRKPKLTKHQRDEALARLTQGETLTAIARSYSVSHMTTITGWRRAGWRVSVKRGHSRLMLACSDQASQHQWPLRLMRPEPGSSHEGSFVLQMKVLVANNL